MWRFQSFVNISVLIHNSAPTVYINLPICLVASIVLVISLRSVDLDRRSDISWSELTAKFDFVGLWVIPSHTICHRLKNSSRFTFMSGTSFIIVGFSFATLNGCE